MITPPANSTRVPLSCLVVGLGVLVATGIEPRDRATWVMEVAPAAAAAVILTATYRRFRFTNLAYALILFHAVVLCLGGHWTYAEMPLGNWLRDALGWQRNNYDRFGHLVQGFVPAIIARELLLRSSPLRRGGWLTYVVLASCLAISAAYELIEWAAAISLGQAADQFLATQGDNWDTQWDMLLALIGAIAALACLSRSHDRALGRLVDSRGGPPARGAAESQPPR